LDRERARRNTFYHRVEPVVINISLAKVSASMSIENDPVKRLIGLHHDTDAVSDHLGIDERDSSQEFCNVIAP
jgi:hypothetical protein